MKRLEHSTMPLARQNDLVIEHLSDEVLVYDLQCNKAHCLGHTAAVVWKLCDGKRSLDEAILLASTQLQMPVTLEVVTFALEQLRRAQMLEQTPVLAGLPQMSRRDLLRKAGVVGAAAVVTSIVAPTAAQAATLRPSGASCSGPGGGGECQSGICSSGACM